MVRVRSIVRKNDDTEYVNVARVDFRFGQTRVESSQLESLALIFTFCECFRIVFLSPPPFFRFRLRCSGNAKAQHGAVIWIWVERKMKLNFSIFFEIYWMCFGFVHSFNNNKNIYMIMTHAFSSVSSGEKETQQQIWQQQQQQIHSSKCAFMSLSKQLLVWCCMCI